MNSQLPPFAGWYIASRRTDSTTGALDPISEQEPAMCVTRDTPRPHEVTRHDQVPSGILAGSDSPTLYCPSHSRTFPTREALLNHSAAALALPTAITRCFALDPTHDTLRSSCMEFRSGLVVIPECPDNHEMVVRCEFQVEQRTNQSWCNTASIPKRCGARPLALYSAKIGDRPCQA